MEPFTPWISIISAQEIATWIGVCVVLGGLIFNLNKTWVLIPRDIQDIRLKQNEQEEKIVGLEDKSTSELQTLKAEIFKEAAEREGRMRVDIARLEGRIESAISGQFKDHDLLVQIQTQVGMVLKSFEQWKK